MQFDSGWVGLDVAAHEFTHAVIDLASGRVRRDGRVLSAEEIDRLLVALRPPESRSKPEVRNPTRFCRTADAASSAERSTNNWNALAQAVGQ